MGLLGRGLGCWEGAGLVVLVVLVVLVKKEGRCLLTEKTKIKRMRR